MARRSSLILAIFSLGVLALAGQPRPAQSARPVTVFAAASLTNAFNAASEDFRRANPGYEVRFSFAASSALRSQLQLGASAEVFASADHEQMAPLVEAKLVKAPVVFARNRLTVVVPTANRANINSPRDLARTNLRVVTTAEQVPIGRYTREALGQLALLPGYPRDYVARVNANVVSREPNARSVLVKTELGEADAAIVYESDARSSERVRAIAIPEKANVIAEYPVAVLRAASNRPGAESFVRYLRSERGRKLLKRFGFR
jgi:molybdate transport system substrate-binding protein